MRDDLTCAWFCVGPRVVRIIRQLLVVRFVMRTTSPRSVGLPGARWVASPGSVGLLGEKSVMHATVPCSEQLGEWTLVGTRGLTMT